MLSADRDTRRMVVDAVRRSGAVGHAAHGGSGPSRDLVARPYHYAFIDVAYPPGDGSVVDGWADTLRLSCCRLVVRGADGDADGERWARERGAVLYLPGRLDAVGFEVIVRCLRAPATRADDASSPSTLRSPSESMSRPKESPPTGQSSA